MSAKSIRLKVKKILASAKHKAGSDSSELVYLVKSETVGGSPLSAGTTTTTTTLLKNAMFSEYNATMFNETIKAGDRMLTCDNDTQVAQGDTVQQGALFYLVVSVDIKAPTSDVLAYKMQVRLK